jgi:hypothetical protein
MHPPRTDPLRLSHCYAAQVEVLQAQPPVAGGVQLSRAGARSMIHLHPDASDRTETYHIQPEGNSISMQADVDMKHSDQMDKKVLRKRAFFVCSCAPKKKQEWTQKFCANAHSF